MLAIPLRPSCETAVASSGETRRLIQTKGLSDFNRSRTFWEGRSSALARSDAAPSPVSPRGGWAKIEGTRTRPPVLAVGRLDQLRMPMNEHGKEAIDTPGQVDFTVEVQHLHPAPMSAP